MGQVGIWGVAKVTYEHYSCTLYFYRSGLGTVGESLDWGKIPPLVDIAYMGVEDLYTCDISCDVQFSVENFDKGVMDHSVYEQRGNI